jgi:hypothetical protein
VAVYSREDDLVLALQQASQALASSGRFNLIGKADGDVAAAERVIQVADVYVAWLRRVEKVTLALVAIEDVATGTATSTPTGRTEVTDINTGQQARYSVAAKDARGFAGDYALAARASNTDVVTVTYLQVGDASNTSNGTTDPTTGASTEIDQVLAVFNDALGTSTVEVFDPADPTVVLASDVIVANPGAVASASLGAATIEPIPAA